MHANHKVIALLGEGGSRYGLRAPIVAPQLQLGGGQPVSQAHLQLGWQGLGMPLALRGDPRGRIETRDPLATHLNRPALGSNPERLNDLAVQQHFLGHFAQGELETTFAIHFGGAALKLQTTRQVVLDFAALLDGPRQQHIF